MVASTQIDNREMSSGERLYPEAVESVDREMRDHFDRYNFAANHCRDVTCLDAAFGAGYGSDILARNAASVLALDFNEHAIAFARERYSRTNLKFEKADLNEPLQMAGNQFDVVVSFETIEHLKNQTGLVREFSKVLKPRGLLLISSPNGTVTAKTGEPPNPFHLHELSRDELVGVLTEHSFVIEELYGQWEYKPANAQSLTRGKSAKALASSIYMTLRKLRNIPLIKKIARHLRAAERFSAYLGESQYIPIRRITLDEADSYRILIAVARKKA